MNTLVYVEKKLILPIAVKLIGSSISKGYSSSENLGFNWFLEASKEFSNERNFETRIAELFPEDIYNYIETKIDNSNLSVRELCEKISSNELSSADVVSVEGKLKIDGLNIQKYNPFDPPDIVLPKTYNIYGENCFSAEVENEGFRFPIYFLTEAKDIVCYANTYPVEVVGVLKWSPSYEVGGYSLNKVIIGAALLFKR